MTALSDLRHALRLLGRSPAFTITAVASLALGIAATTAIFGLADALLFRPRAGVANPATLVDIGRTTNGNGLDNFGYPLFVAMREQATLLDGISANRISPEVMALGDATSSERVFATLVSANYFEVVGTRAAAGRFFAADEDRTPGERPVVVLSHQFWTRRFGGDPDIVGQTLRLNNLAYTVVGVAEAGFTGTSVMGTDLWVPMAMDAHVRASEQSLLATHQAVWLTAIGRLKPGVTPAQARDELAGIMRGYLTERGDARADRWGVAVARSSRVPASFAGPVLGFIGLLTALTGLVLLIACSNVAAMLLARALERRREVATRLAIGASRARILWQLFVEGAVLAVIAGIVSIPLTWALTALLSSYQPSLPVPIALDLRVDPRVVLFAFGLSGLTAVTFALVPALQATRFDVAPALHGQHTTIDRRRAWLRQGLVTAQVAMALLLLVAAGLFLRSLQQAATIDLGFAVANIDTLQIDTRIGGYRTDEEGVRVVNDLMERFRALPGVTAVGASRMTPLVSGRLGLGELRAQGYVGPDGTDQIDAGWDVVTPGYFEALAMDIVRGRAFDRRDTAGGLPVVIVNETLAARVWPGQDPLGRVLTQRGFGEERTLQVVGVARAAKYGSISEPPTDFVYVPHAQQFMSETTFYVRRSGRESRLADLRAAVVGFDPNLPVIHTQTLEAATAIALLPQRLAGWIAASVGAVGLLLAAMGLYGLTAFSVARRRREIALRMALGATRGGVLALVLRQSGLTAASGAVVGLVLAAGVSSLAGSLLIGIGTVDPVAFGAATLLLTLVLLGATWVPAQRAASMDPMGALRAE